MFKSRVYKRYLKKYLIRKIKIKIITLHREPLQKYLKKSKINIKLNSVKIIVYQ